MNQLCKRENLIVNGYMVIWEEGERERERERRDSSLQRERGKITLYNLSLSGETYIIVKLN